MKNGYGSKFLEMGLCPDHDGRYAMDDPSYVL